MLLFFRLCSMHQAAGPSCSVYSIGSLGLQGSPPSKDSQQIGQASPFSALRQPAYQGACPGSCRHGVGSLLPYP